jgi:nucleoside phosphorylase
VLVVAATERELVHVRRFETFACGIGPVEAALSTARALSWRAPAAVVDLGIAGAAGGALGVGAPRPLFCTSASPAPEHFRC